MPLPFYCYSLTLWNDINRLKTTVKWQLNLTHSVLLYQQWIKWRSTNQSKPWAFLQTPPLRRVSTPRCTPSKPVHTATDRLDCRTFSTKMLTWFAPATNRHTCSSYQHLTGFLLSGKIWTLLDCTSHTRLYNCWSLVCITHTVGRWTCDWQVTVQIPAGPLSSNISQLSLGSLRGC